MPDLTKPIKGAYRKARKRKRYEELEWFRINVNNADSQIASDVIGGNCCNPWCPRKMFTPRGRTYYEAIHLRGRGRSGDNDPSNGMQGCWFCHDAVDGRHHELWPELSPDERKVKILVWWKENQPDHFKQRGWQRALTILENSVARKK